MKNIARKLSALLLVFVVSAAALCPAFAAKAGPAGAAQRTSMWWMRPTS